MDRQAGSKVTRSRKRRQSRHRRLIAVTWIVATLAAAAWLAAPSAGAATPPVVTTGQLPLDLHDPALDSKARLLYDIDAGGEGVVTVYRADPPYTKLGVVQLPIVGSTQNSGGQGAAFAVDEVHHRLFVAVTPPPNFVSQKPTTQGSDKATLLIIDGPSRQVVGRVPMYTGAKPGGLDVSGEAVTGLVWPNIAYDAVHDRLYGASTLGLGAVGESGVGSGAVVAGAVVVQVNPTKAIEWYADPTHFHTASPSADWSFVLPQCEVMVKSRGGWPARNGDNVLLPCTGVDRSEGSQPEVTQGLFSLPLGHDAQGNETPPADASKVGFSTVLGSYDRGSSLYDPTSNRAIFISANFGPAAAILYDVAHSAIVGLVGRAFGTALLNACLNGQTGRMYLFTSTDNTVPPGAQNVGLLVGEARAREVPYPQGFGFPSYAGVDAPTVVCDPVGNKVYARYLGVWKIIEDHLSAYVAPPPLHDPDLDTTDIPFNPAKVRMSFNGSARAYAARVELVGGTGAIKANYEGVDSNGALGLSSASPILTFAASGIPGESSDVSISDAQSTANAIAVWRDSSTKTATSSTPGDPTGLSPVQPPQEPIPDKWPYNPVNCTTPNGADPVEAGDVDASVSCDSVKGTATASTQPRGVFEIPGVLRMAGVGSSVTTSVDKTTGILTTKALSHVGSISLGDGQIELDNVDAMATSTAAGRPGTASGAYIRSIGRFILGGNIICGQSLDDPKADANPCDPRQVVDRINAIPQGTVQASLPAPDGVPAPGEDPFYAIAGTPKGAESSVVRDHWQQLNDQAINEITPYDQVVPALRLTVGNDTYRHSQLMVDLAEPLAFSRVTIKPCPFCRTAPATTTTTAKPLLHILSNDADVPRELPEATAPAATPTTAAAQPTTTTAPGDDGSSADVEAARDDSTSPYVTTTSSQPAPSPRHASLAHQAAQAATQAARRLGKGLAIVFTSPRRLLELLLVWSVMTAPVYLSSRRQLALRRMTL